VEQEVKDVLDT